MLRCWAQFWTSEQPTQFPTSVAAVSAAWAHPARPTPQHIAHPLLDHASTTTRQAIS
jgi:hypothetical protein